MADEERGKELPQRVRGATRATPPAPVSSLSALSDELRQRLQAAVEAERSGAAPPKQEPPKQKPPKGINGKHGQAAKPEPATRGKPGLFFEEDDEVTALHPVTPSKLAEASPASPKQIAPAPAGRPVSSPPVTAKKPKKPSHPRPGSRLRTWLVFAVFAGLVAGVLAVVAVRYFGRPAARPPSAAQLHQDAAIRAETATWLIQHVSQDATVGCDRVMCAALTARGFPARDLLVLGPASGDPFRAAAVVVDTPAVLGLFGSSLGTAWAPDVLASFGSGPARITVRVVAPHGAAAYRAQQKTDLAARKTAGAALLNDSQILVPPLAGLQLAAGQVDSRVLLALADLAGQQPISIVQFGDDGPGASGDLPLCFVDLAENVPAAHQAPAAYVRSVRAYLGRAGNKYRPASMTTVVQPDGQAALRVDFSAPSPFGVFGTPATP